MIKPDISFTSILHILIVPDTDSPEHQSPFQGFLLDLFNDSYIMLMHYMSIQPSSALEVYMEQDELVNFRNTLSVSNNFLLDKSSFSKRIEAFNGHPFIYCYCSNSDIVTYVNKACEDFKFKPITVGFDKSCDISITQDSNEFSTFLLDASIAKKIDSVKRSGRLPTEILNFLNNKNKRNTTTVPLKQISYSHAVTNPSEAVLYALGYNLPKVKRITGSSNRDVYINAMTEVSDTVFDISMKKSKAFTKSDLIVYSPSIFTHLYNFNSQFWNHIKRIEKSKKVRDFIMKGLFQNPNYSGFDIKVNTKEELEEILKSKVINQIVEIRQSELALSSAAINFLSVSNNSPALRLPNSINFFHAKLKDIESLSQSNKPKSINNLQRKFKDFTSCFKHEIGDTLCNYISKNSKSLILCTDSILDWVSIDRIPLMFTHEISKINTTPGNKFLQESTNFSHFSLKQKDLTKITVIRSFKDNDKIKHILENSLDHYINIDNQIELEIIDVSTSEEFIHTLSNLKTSILILDCHGNHGGSESHGWLQIGDEQVDIWSLPVVCPPIIILSACLTSAIGGSHASVANGFLSRGSLSVLGTLLPVDALKSAIFIGRLIYRLSGYLNALKEVGVKTISWRQFIAGFLRMSFCTDFLCILRDEHKLLNERQYKEIHVECNYIINSNSPNWYDKALEAINNNTGLDINMVDGFIQNVGLTETMYYSQLGRPENIIIELE
ncbi:MULTISPECIES: hypothetical protein [Pseudoalteromonas]|uniref:hypothetical protein n=1 Tax=Pseudoalteromonas TaxID=53246 RepID=UPI0002AA684C|nr:MULTISPECIES: hypothetical protein [Pseudoalteromonas]